MKTLICLENTSYSQFSDEVINSVNTFVENSIEEISIASLDETLSFKDANTAIFKPNEIDSFRDGLIITNSINTMNLIKGSANNSQRILYLYDLDWMFQQMYYNDIYSILTDPTIKLIIRSKSHIKPIKNISNREPDAVIEKFDLEKIWNLL
jgi:sugar-specific transcriptional regulator TrmB